MIIPQVSLVYLQDRYPDGVYSHRHGCYYFVDYDGNLGYFHALTNGNFEDEVEYVDFDTMNEVEAEELRLLQAHLAFYL